MPTLRYILILGLCFSAILSACSPATLASTSVPIIPTSQPKPTSPPATLAPTPEPAGIGVPSIVYKSGQNVLMVVSSVTGTVLDGYAPIQLGQVPSYAFSPDQHTLAIVGYVSDSYPANAQLFLVDLPSWKYRVFKLDVNDWVASMIFNADGSLLAIGAGGSNGALHIVDTKSGEVKAATEAGLAIRNMKFTSDGKAIMVYGPRFAQNVAVSVGAPKAVLYAASDLSILWSADLNRVRDGIFPKKEGTSTQDLFQPGVAWNFTPGVTFASNQDVLYVVHGDEDKLTTVDFTGKKVKTVNIYRKTGWLDQLMALTAGVAYAKGMDGTEKQAAISSDGKSLYVVGVQNAVTQNQNGNWDFTQTPLGLQVIAVEDGNLIDQFETDATSIDMSPDGQYLFLRGWKNDSDGTAWTEIFDTSSNSIVKHVDGVSLIQTHRIDGQAILMSSRPIGENAFIMAVIEPDIWAIVTEWKGPDYIGWLIDP